MTELDARHFDKLFDQIHRRPLRGMVCSGLPQLLTPDTTPMVLVFDGVPYHLVGSSIRDESASNRKLRTEASRSNKFAREPEG